MALGQEAIGRRIADARERAGITQAQLAERVGVATAQTVSRWERGETDVPPKRLRRIAEATGKPLSFFVQEIEREARPLGEPDVLRRIEETQSAMLAEIQALREELRGGASSSGSA